MKNIIANSINQYLFGYLDYIKIILQYSIKVTGTDECKMVDMEEPIEICRVKRRQLLITIQWAMYLI